MRALAAVAIVLTLSGSLATPAVAACFSGAEQRRLIRSGEALRPGRIGRILQGEVLRIQLCEHRTGLIYQVTVLTGNGQVKRHIVDARNGRVIR